MAEPAVVLTASNVCKTFTKKVIKPVQAVKSVSLELVKGETLAIVGADGAGKTTLLRLLASLLRPDAGEIRLNGRPLAEERDNVAYMPQKFGLYEDLSVQENLDLFADLNNLGKEDRRERFDTLLRMSALAPFTDRLAGALSGGMKQKLGLICTLVNPPEVLLLDEPTVGVDPFSRRELWNILDKLTGEGNMSVVVTTPYLDEAQTCDKVIVLHEGEVLDAGVPEKIVALSSGMTYLVRTASRAKPRELQSHLLNFPGCVNAVPQGGAVRFVHQDLTGKTLEAFRKYANCSELRPVPSNLEDSVMLLLYRKSAGAGGPAQADLDRLQPLGDAAASPDDSVIIKTENVYKKFGSFIAVNDVSFTVRKGEVFGLLGPNGAGKTTTFKMLCGLSKPTEGKLLVNGNDVRKASVKVRSIIGYVAQKFSLYGQLTVKENLDFFGQTYGLYGDRLETRQKEVLEEFSLADQENRPAEELPGGYLRRLTMAAALQHSPTILFLDEPTSGADPIARREFWQRITRLAEQNVTVIVTTHFMEEAEYCDHLIIQDSGRMIAQGTPAEIRNVALSPTCTEPTMEDAFIAIVSEHRQGEGTEHAK